MRSIVDDSTGTVQTVAMGRNSRSGFRSHNPRTGQSKYDDADALFKRSLSIFEQSIGPDSPEVGSVLDAVSSMYAMQGKYVEAQPIYARLVELEGKIFGQRSLVLASTLDGYAQALRKLGQDAKADELEGRAKTIRAAQPKTPTATTAAHGTSSKSTQQRPN